MTEISCPHEDIYPALRSLWKQAFGDTDEFVNLFMSSAFSPSRCRCVTQNGKLFAALYWFDCSCNGRKTAYIYAVATDEAHRGKGLCHALMQNTHEHLKNMGYACALLVPASEKLSAFYGKMGYKNCRLGVERVECGAKDMGVKIRNISKQEYAEARRRFLPTDGVVQECENLDVLMCTACRYAGDDFVLAARKSKEKLFATELLGNAAVAEGIVHALGCRNGLFRVPSDNTPFAMYLPLCAEGAEPSYLGLAFD